MPDAPIDLGIQVERDHKAETPNYDGGCVLGVKGMTRKRSAQGLWEDKGMASRKK